MKLPRLLPGSALLCFVLTTSAAPTDSLESGFLNPPDSAKPQTWWHWMNGNITKDGITADLEAMKGIGLGGATIVNVDCGIPPGPVEFMSPEWQDDFKFAVQEASRLGLQLGSGNAPGWSNSGGPWITATNAMQRVTTSEVRVTGPTNFNAPLPQPPTTLDFYRDIAVLAFPTPADEAAKPPTPKVTTSAADLDASPLVDGKNSTPVALPPPARGHPQFFQFEFPRPLRALTVLLTAGPGVSNARGAIQTSGDGVKFRECARFTLPRWTPQPVPVDLGDGGVTARYYRVVFDTPGREATNLSLCGVEFSARLRLNNFEDKAGNNNRFIRSMSDDNHPPVGSGVRHSKTIDLTAKLGDDGRLNWKVPRGDWTILRVGYTPTGAHNHPAPKGGEGLECDKLSQVGIDANWAGFMQKLIEDAGPLAGKTFNGSLIDSYEVGGQNWTGDFREEFQKRRGYDPLKFLPAFTGRVVDNPEVSERFLWDVRRTIADLFAENYYGHFSELCREHGLESEIEPYTGPFESLQSGASADPVMGEFWSGTKGDQSVKLAASVAHIYGKQIVGAESFTAGPGADHGRWLDTPYTLKALGDSEYCTGLNRYIFHRYAMQPWTNRWPGMTMGQWGIHLDRTETWWTQGKAWMDYISRCQFLLQQGLYVADAAYFDGESAPCELRDGKPPLPAGYQWDDVNADVLLHHTTVKDGRLTLDSGASYAVLILPPDDSNLTPPLLQRLRDFVHDGLAVVGVRPQHSSSLDDYPRCDREVKSLAKKLWAKCDGVKITENKFGRGRIVWGKPLTDVFTELNLPPDFEFQSPGANANLLYCHRQLPAADIYFISDQRHKFGSAECSFRVTGKVPEIWNAETGDMAPAPVWREENGRTIVPLSFGPADSLFVLFRKPAGDRDHFVTMTDNAAPNAVAAAAAPKLEIQSARYETRDGAQGNDVTDRLKDLAADGTGLNFVVNNDTLGGDPAFQQTKQLHVKYVLDGKPGERIVAENEILNLGTVTDTGAPPVFSLVADTAGNVSLLAFAPGVVDLLAASGKKQEVKVPDVPAPAEITGDWQLNFPPNWGAPDSVTLDKLISWTDHTNAGVKYFSGTATYEKEIEIPTDDLTSNREVWLDLGAVKNFAEVSLNGQDFGVLWKPPFRVNITAAAKPGANKLMVKVTNLWPNRLIGDEQLPPDVEWNGKQLASWPQWLLDGKPSPTGRLTFTTWHHWTKNDAPLESGLLGPVTLRTAEIFPAN